MTSPTRSPTKNLLMTMMMMMMMMSFGLEEFVLCTLDPGKVRYLQIVGSYVLLTLPCFRTINTPWISISGM